jgi:hypothetical protein
MITVLQCVKCVFWSLKWSKLAIVGTVRASHQRKPNFDVQKIFRLVPANFLQGLRYKNISIKHEKHAPGCKMCVLTLQMVKIC